MGWTNNGLNIPSLSYVSLLQNVQTGFGANLISYSVGTWDYFPRLMRQELEANHVQAFSSDIEN